MALSPPSESFIILSIIPVAAFYITRVNGLGSSSCLNNIQNFLFFPQNDSLFNINELPIFFTFDPLCIRQVGINDLKRIARSSSSGIRNWLPRTVVFFRMSS